MYTWLDGNFYPISYDIFDSGYAIEVGIKEIMVYVYLRSKIYTYKRMEEGKNAEALRELYNKGILISVVTRKELCETLYLSEKTVTALIKNLASAGWIDITSIPSRIVMGKMFMMPWRSPEGIEKKCVYERFFADLLIKENIEKYRKKKKEEVLLVGCPNCNQVFNMENYYEMER